jgi:hypothetical protein
MATTASHGPTFNGGTTTWPWRSASSTHIGIAWRHDDMAMALLCMHDVSNCPYGFALLLIVKIEATENVCLVRLILVHLVEP